MNNIEKFLTPRLKMIASLVPVSESICDIGTDHGYVSVYLAKSGRSRKIIASDINEGPLFYARKNIRIFNVEQFITTRISNGFEKINEGEAESAIIAGMGGETISDILKIERCTKNYILQPQSAHMELRKFLSANGFNIVKEKLCREGDKFYVAMLVKKGEPYNLTRTEQEIGPLLIKERPPLFNEYVKFRLHEILCVLKKLENAPSADEKKAEYNFLKTEYENLIKEL